MWEAAVNRAAESNGAKWEQLQMNNNRKYIKNLKKESDRFLLFFVSHVSVESANLKYIPL